MMTSPLSYSIGHRSCQYSREGIPQRPGYQDLGIIGGGGFLESATHTGLNLFILSKKYCWLNKLECKLLEDIYIFSMPCDIFDYSFEIG